jgi:hypothetical protein
MRYASRVAESSAISARELSNGKSAELGTKLLSDQLSDYRVDDPYIQAHVHGSSPRSVPDLDDSPTVLRDEEVAGSNPVTPTTLNFDRPE